MRLPASWLSFMQRVRGWVSSYVAVLSDPTAGKMRRLRFVLSGAAAMLGIGLALLAIYAVALIPFTPGISELKKAKVERPAMVRSADGKELATYKRLNREWVELARISPSVITALIATEDHRFYAHGGIDLRRTLAAAYYSLRGDRQGGSTITQQLARNLYPEQIGRAPTLSRKLKEMITALKIESVYTKQEILETYLNTVPFLYNAFGIEMAARTYFGKSAGALNVLEGATLIGMLKGTSYYNPVLNPDRALARRNLVLAQMVRHDRLEQARYEALSKRPLRLNFERQLESVGPAPHFAAHLRKWLIAWADRNGYNIYADGLVVVTSIDSRLQSFADRAVTRQLDALQAVADVEWGLGSDRLLSTELGAYRAHQGRTPPFAHFWASKPELLETFIRESAPYRALAAEGLSDSQRVARLRSDRTFMTSLRAEKTRLQSGFIALDPRNGQVKAWIGSRDFGKDQFDHVIQAKRQPGSTFKPFVYATALKQGMNPATAFHDTAVEIPLGGGSTWRPSDAQAPSGRKMSMREGLVHSKNTITAQVMHAVGPTAVAGVAHDMGIRQSRLDPVPSLALGTSPVSLSEMVAGYATIANGGSYIAPLLVTRIEDAGGNVIEEFRHEEQRALSKPVSLTLLDMMRGVVNEGTGSGIRRVFGIVADVAGKTGTTQDNTDGWFILIHGELVGGAWVGFNDNRVTMRSAHWGQGAHNALYVVGDFFQQVLGGRRIDPRAPLSLPREPVAPPLLERLERWLEGIFDRAPAPPPRRNRSHEGSQMQFDDDPPTRVFRGERSARPQGAPEDSRPERRREHRERLRERAEEARENRRERKERGRGRGRRKDDDDDDDDDDD